MLTHKLTLSLRATNEIAGSSSWVIIVEDDSVVIKTAQQNVEVKVGINLKL